MASKSPSTPSVNIFICLQRLRGGASHLWPLSWSQRIRQVQSITKRLYRGYRTAACTHSWFLTRCLPPRTPSAPEGRGKTGATCQHLTRPTTQPARQAQRALPHHGRPSIIDEMKCDEVLLWAHKDHALFHVAMWPCDVLNYIFVLCDLKKIAADTFSLLWRCCSEHNRCFPKLIWMPECLQNI